MKKIIYNIGKFNFREKIQKHYNVAFESFHIAHDYKLRTRETDQQTEFHKIFYNSWDNDSELRNMYDDFMIKVVKPMFDNDEIVYQAKPSFRVQLPNNLGVGEFHKDSKYREDKEWVKKIKEQNFFLPLTNAKNTATIWVESEPDKGDYSPMDCEYGDLVMWDGANLTHGNKQNKTEFTRVSMDFRVMKKENYSESSAVSINTKIPFRIGGYYKTI